MKDFLRQALGRMLGRACGFTNHHLPPDHLPGFEPLVRSPGSSDMHQGDPSLLQTRSEVTPSATTMGEEEAFRVEGLASNDQTLLPNESRDLPRFSDAAPKITLVKDDDGQIYFALVVTETMFEVQNDLSLADQDLRAKELELQKIQKKVVKLEHLITDTETLPTPTAGQDERDHALDKAENLRLRLEQLCDRKRLVQAEIGAIKDNIDFCNRTFQRMSQRAMEQANLLKKREIPHDSLAQDGEDEDDDEVEVEGEEEGSELPIETPAELLLSDEQKLVREAQMNFDKTEQTLCQIQAEFDRKDWRYRMELADFEAAVAAGETDWTRSQFDRQAILIGQDLTRNLINAEYAFDNARDQAERIGAFDDGWGQESYYGDSQRTQQSFGANQVPEGESPSALSAFTQNFIENWVAEVAAPKPDEVTEPMDVDDWDSAPVGLSDSVSCVDFGPLGRRIVEWGAYCDGHRQEWRTQEYEIEDVWTGGHSLLSRRRSCGV